MISVTFHENQFVLIWWNAVSCWQSFCSLVNMDERVSIKNRLQYIFILLTDASRNKILHRFTGVSLQDAYPRSRISWRCMSAKCACLEDTSAALGFSIGVHFILEIWFLRGNSSMLKSPKYRYHGSLLNIACYHAMYRNRSHLKQPGESKSENWMLRQLLLPCTFTARGTFFNEYLILKFWEAPRH